VSRDHRARSKDADWTSTHASSATLVLVDARGNSSRANTAPHQDPAYLRSLYAAV
jgi:hypothetical protein